MGTTSSSVRRGQLCGRDEHGFQSVQPAVGPSVRATARSWFRTCVRPRVVPPVRRPFCSSLQPSIGPSARPPVRSSVPSARASPQPSPGGAKFLDPWRNCNVINKSIPDRQNDGADLDFLVLGIPHLRQDLAGWTRGLAGGRAGGRAGGLPSTPQN